MVICIKKLIKYNLPGMHILYPPGCLVCGTVLYADEQGVCKKCSGRLPYIIGTRCIICSKQTENGSIRCRDCMNRDHEYERGYALWSYNRVTEKIIADIKYNRRLAGMPYIVDELVYRCAGLFRLWEIEALVPVPLHKRKLRQRGFNQAALLGESLADRMKIAYMDDVLYRVRYTRPQKNLDDRARKNNLRNAFLADEGRFASYGITGNIVLIDDIYTSGSTIDECVGALKEVFSGKIYFVCLCIGDGY
jgi:ComF family protein